MWIQETCCKYDFSPCSIRNEEPSLHKKSQSAWFDFVFWVIFYVLMSAVNHVGISLFPCTHIMFSWECDCVCMFDHNSQWSFFLPCRMTTVALWKSVIVYVCAITIHNVLFFCCAGWQQSHCEAVSFLHMVGPRGPYLPDHSAGLPTKSAELQPREHCSYTLSLQVGLYWKTIF